MRSIRYILTRLTMGAVLATSAGACAAAAVGAAAGAAGAVAYTQRGAETRLDAPVPVVASAAEDALADMGIRVTGVSAETDESEVEIRGESGDDDIVVQIERDGELTHVHVSAREDLVEYDPEYAEEILREIMERV